MTRDERPAAIAVVTAMSIRAPVGRNHWSGRRNISSPVVFATRVSITSVSSVAGTTSTETGCHSALPHQVLGDVAVDLVTGLVERGLGLDQSPVLPVEQATERELGRVGEDAV